MSKSLPPLIWTRAFYFVGSAGSFRAAADELNVSPSTISHEIRKLESWVGVPLFIRGPKKVAFTIEGKRLFAEVQPAFEQLSSAFSTIRDGVSEVMKIGMLPFFANEIFMPKMNQLPLESYSIQITNSIALEILADKNPNTRMDAIIRYSSYPATGYENILLTKVSIALGVSERRDRKDKSALKKIQVASSFDGWARFEDADQLALINPNATIKVTDYLSALSAIEQDLGIGIVVLPLSSDRLSHGKIRIVEGSLRKIPESYWFTYSRESAKRSALERMAEGLQQYFHSLTE